MPRRSRTVALVLSCEHGGNRIPARYHSLFQGSARVLASHRGWDPGALAIARALARACGAPLIATLTSRLLVECNRSPGHPELFSEYTRTLDDVEKTRLLARYYHPHRNAVEQALRDALAHHERVVHVGVHTFTPVLDGRRRLADIGILYDPARGFERKVADHMLRVIGGIAPGLRVRRNYPYRGWTDGLTTTLRGRFPAGRYAGIELEVNQARARDPRAVARVLGDALSGVASGDT